MDYYVSKKAGSILLRAPNKLHLVAGDHIPTAHWNAIEGAVRAQFIKDGVVEGFEDPDSVKLSEAPPVVQPIKIGVGKTKFMEEAKVQPGERRDAALDKLLKEQRDAKVDARKESSPDGVVHVELPPDEDDDEDEDALTDEELAAIRLIEAEDS